MTTLLFQQNKFRKNEKHFSGTVQIYLQQCVEQGWGNWIKLYQTKKNKKQKQKKHPTKIKKKKKKENPQKSCFLGNFILFAVSVTTVVHIFTLW